PQDCVAEIRDMYRDRRDVLIEGLSQAGWDVPSPPATMFAWAKLPPAFEAMGSLQFSKLLLQEAEVAVSPGVGFGEHGDQHVRISLVENKHRTRQAVRNIKSFLKSHQNWHAGAVEEGSTPVASAISGGA
ncbi:MAG: aminotransferase class I/II-fold pyridoxal phosphate-dependent enzyme, partial [Rhodospirillaceae bacterium]